ncbi:hypothetical protein M432DRAFT_457820 [Thermoascus aurantiacus ATCC 26904]
MMTIASLVLTFNILQTEAQGMPLRRSSWWDVDFHRVLCSKRVGPQASIRSKPPTRNPPRIRWTMCDVWLLADSAITIAAWHSIRFQLLACGFLCRDRAFGPSPSDTLDSSSPMMGRLVLETPLPTRRRRYSVTAAAPGTAVARIGVGSA